MSWHKLVVKKEIVNGLSGIQTLNVIPQPLIDEAGNIDMSSNYLKVRNMEAGITKFTTNGDIGVINAYSDSTNTNVSCINFMHDPPNGSNRRYCSFQSKNGGHVTGSITGNGGQVSYNTTSDSRLKNVDNYTGSYITDKITYKGYGTWLDSVNALNPCIYSYKGDMVGINNESFTYKLQSGMTEDSVLYQGFLAHEIQTVYPPAVTGMSGETININGVDEPVYQQVDMTKLIPMMVGAIKELSTTVNSLTTNVNTLTTTISDLSLFSILNPIWNSWTIFSINDTIRLFSTTDASIGLNTYDRTINKLSSIAWGVNQINTPLFTTVEEKREYLDYQLSQMYFKFAPVTDMRFIYDFNGVWNSQELKMEYSYNYYIKDTSSGSFENTFIDLSVNSTTDMSGVFALIYDPDENTYSQYQILKSINIDNFTWNTVKMGETTTAYYSTFSNETNSLATFYDNIQPNLTSDYWGATQYNTLLPIGDRMTLLQEQLNKLIYAPV